MSQNHVAVHMGFERLERNLTGVGGDVTEPLTSPRHVDICPLRCSQSLKASSSFTVSWPRAPVPDPLHRPLLVPFVMSRLHLVLLTLLPQTSYQPFPKPLKVPLYPIPQILLPCCFKDALPASPCDPTHQSPFRSPVSAC